MEHKSYSRKLVMLLLVISSLSLALVCLGAWKGWDITLRFPDFFGGGQKTDPSLPPALLTVGEINPSLLNAPLYVAQNLHFFNPAVVKVELTKVQDGEEALELLAANSVQVIVGSPDLAVRSLSQETRDNRDSQDKQAKPLVFAQLSNNTGVFLLKRTTKTLTDQAPNTQAPGIRPPAQTPEDTIPFDWPALKGKTVVSFSRGSIPDMALGCELKRHGLIPQQSLNLLQNIPSQDLAPAFLSGSGDYILAREPLVSFLEAEEAASVVIRVYGCSGKLPALCTMAAESFSRQNPRVLQSYTNGLFRAQLWLASHSPQEIVAVLKPNLSAYSSQNLLKAVTRYKNLGVWSNRPLLEEQAFQNLQQIMIQSGESKAVLPFKDLAETKFAREAVSTKANYPDK